MGLLCKLLGHKWNGCKCSRCKEVRNEQHTWNASECLICGWVIEKAKIYGIIDQKILSNIAKTAPDTDRCNSDYERKRAIEIASAAIEKIADQDILADIARNMHTYDIKIARLAMEKITDRFVIINIMEDDSFNDNHFRKLKDLFLDILIYIAKNKNIKQDKRLTAFLLIDDKSVFAADEMKELESLEREKYSNSLNVPNTLPTQDWEY
jgi:hypothetical protein